MSDMLFERDLRAALDGLTTSDIPRSLAARVTNLSFRDARGGSWLGRLATSAAATFAVLLVVVVGAVTVSRAGWSSPTTGSGDEPKPFTWGTQLATLAADRLTVEVGGRTFAGIHDVDYVHSDPGSATYRTLELAWHDARTEMRLSLYFDANATSWWIQHARTYDGSERGDWVYYPGPSFRMPLGQSYSGNVDLFGVGLGGVGRLRIEGMTLTAFEPGTIPPRFDSCQAVGPGRGNPLGPPVGQEPHPDLSMFRISEGMAATDVQAELVAQGICHEFRLEFPSINRAQIWCSAPPGKVREFAFGSSGQIIVFVEDPSRLPLDTELPQVVGC